jgi:hypothetical protein
MAEVRALALASLLALGCRGHGSSVPPGATSRVVVHSTIPAPVELRVREGVAIVGDDPSPAGSARAATPTAVAEFPAEVACRMQSLCVVVVRRHALAVVFAFDPVVEIEVERPAPTASPFVQPRYRDRRSTSAALGAVLRDASALKTACIAGDTHAIHRLRGRMHRRTKRDRRDVVRDAARLALLTESCGTAPDRSLARAVIAELDPRSPALSLWTLGLVRASEQLGGAPEAAAAIETVIAEHPDADVGAFLLSRLAFAAERRKDEDAAQQYDARLAAPRFAATPTAGARRMYVAMREPLRVGPGDTLPTVELATLDGSTSLSTAPADAAPQLVYFSASWCRGCVASLPKLHGFAAAHPDVRILYVLWDSPDDAEAFVRRRGPLPGTVALADGPARTAIRSAFFKLVALPTFVLADGTGRIVATSMDHELDELDDVLPAP